MWERYPDALQFAKYICDTWAPLAHELSTYKCPARTNNISESFHSTIGRKLPSHANIWTFLDKLTNIIKDQEMDLNRLKNGKHIRRTVSHKSHKINMKIVGGQTNLVNGRIDVDSFLRLFTKLEATGRHGKRQTLVQENRMNEKENLNADAENISQYPNSKDLVLKTAVIKLHRVKHPEQNKRILLVRNKKQPMRKMNMK